MNILSFFIIVPLLMLAGLWASRSVNQVRGVMVTGASLLLALSVYLTIDYIGLRQAGAMEEMLFTDSISWYAPLHICYSIGVDGISVAMLLLSAIIVFTGTFASWKLQPLTKEYFLWFTLLSLGVFGFFISTDLFTMFMFYEVALIPMYLLIGIWGSGRKEYAAMKLTLMLMGGSAFLLIGILGIFYGAGGETMNLLEIARLHIPDTMQHLFFPLIFLGFGVLGALFPFHTWSPDGHASAPTAVSMLHAGVLMKLGGYGCFRVAMYLMPEGAAMWGDVFLVLTTISVVYGCVQRCGTDRLEIYQCLFIRIALRTGAFRSSDDDTHQLYGSHPPNAEPRSDDSFVLCPDRYDLRPHPYTRCTPDGRTDENHAISGCGLCHCGSCQSGVAGIEWICGRNDRLCRLVPKQRYLPPCMHADSYDKYRDYCGLYSACSR